MRWWPFERSFRRRLGTVRRSPSPHLGCRNRARRRSFSFKPWGTQVRSRAMSVARARRRGSTTSVLGRHHGRVRRMVPASLHWERKRGEQCGWSIVRQIQAEWLIQVDWSSSLLAFELHRWQGARLWRRLSAQRSLDCLFCLAPPIRPVKVPLRIMELICRFWRWIPSPSVGVGLADCTHVHLHWSWPRCCRR